MGHATACEFLYPVAAISENHILVIYQKNSSHLELWDWNPQTNQANLALLSRFTPAGVKLLPNKKGYSFVDHGVIKIRDFKKRSPKTIEIDTPLYNIEVLNWIDEKRCYTHAMLGDRFGIFEITDEGEVSPLIVSKDFDCSVSPKSGGVYFLHRKRAGEISIKETAL